MRSLATIFGVWWARAFRRSPITFIPSSGLTSSCCSSGLVSRSRLLCSFGGGTLDEVLCNMVDKERTIENAVNMGSAEYYYHCFQSTGKIVDQIVSNCPDELTWAWCTVRVAFAGERTSRCVFRRTTWLEPAYRHYPASRPLRQSLSKETTP
ncbi:Hypothetical protein, putative [Bodo saltans]|uniref:Uncharacterized protein n=1 Tax=Bodo saltans TaxID=75058 RepID=A0A0S4J470_BODSA|nr:Hypothetical protein, putative [Bodo saltans]|eukprot:CUG74640.1 Hypothetical protein, putative [Bodo saltans]